jgi:hypothetical protein
MVVEGLMAEFEAIGDLRKAVARIADAGYRNVDAYMPFPDEVVLQRLGPRPFRITVVGGVFALVGALVGYGLQWLLNAVLYPLDVGGRPPHAVAAFLPITFETAVLSCGIATFVATLAWSGLPRLWRPEFEIEGFERTSIDRFWVFVAAEDKRFDWDATHELLRSLGPLRIVPVPVQEEGR